MLQLVFILGAFMELCDKLILNLLVLQEFEILRVHFLLGFLFKLGTTFFVLLKLLQLLVVSSVQSALNELHFKSEFLHRLLVVIFLEHCQRALPLAPRVRGAVTGEGREGIPLFSQAMELVLMLS